jgi:hypothetical protein
MNVLIFPFLFAAVGADKELTTSYVQELRSEVALADHLVLRTSPENGGATRSTNDLAELREIAKLFPKSATVLASQGNISSTDYATIAVYDAPHSKRPRYEITVTPSHCAFTVKTEVYEFKTVDASLYRAVVKAANRRE